MAGYVQTFSYTLIEGVRLKGAMNTCMELVKKSLFVFVAMIVNFLLYKRYVEIIGLILGYSISLICLFLLASAIDYILSINGGEKNLLFYIVVSSRYFFMLISLLGIALINLNMFIGAAVGCVLVYGVIFIDNIIKYVKGFLTD